MECPICGSTFVREADVYSDEEVLQLVNYKFICEDCNYEWE